jgi:1,6-anhydro-N-acetylmuramate kinase
MRAVGLMSGTSLDSIDVTMIETDGETATGFGPNTPRSCTAEQQALVRPALLDTAGLAHRTLRVQRGLPITFPGTSGVPHAMAVGVIVKPFQV